MLKLPKFWKSCRAFDEDGEFTDLKVACRCETCWWSRRRERVQEAEEESMKKDLRDESLRVYFIYAETVDLVKIGVARDPDQRLRRIQEISPVPLRIIASAVGGFQQERNMHLRFTRLRSHGEWFRFGSEIKELLSALKDFDNDCFELCLERVGDYSWLV